MINWDLKKKLIAVSVVAFLSVSAGVVAVLYQPSEKTDEIFTSALKDFNEGKYQNSYYLFSKISFISNLKPVSIYHRAECAKMLNDTKSELKQYDFLIKYYPKHILALKSRYLTAQKLFEENPQSAQKHFEYIIKNSPDTDYAIASEYYLGVILKNKHKDSTNISASTKNEIQNYFRHYLKKAPSGKHALNAVNNWLEFMDNIQKDDYLLMANTCYLFGEYEKADELLKKSNPDESWVLDAKNSYAMQNYAKVKKLVETGLSKHSVLVSEDDVIEVIDLYNKISGNSLNRLLELTSGKGRDYLQSLKCQQVSQSDKYDCYSKLYLKYPNGKFSADALLNVFFSKYKSKDYQNAMKIGQDYLNKFAESNSAPFVLYWMGKISEKTSSYDEYTNFYKRVIEKYPDSYYAFRSYLNLRRIPGPLITNYIKVQPVIYPYKYTKNNIIVKLVNLGDYDIVNEFANGDEFIKSWVLYKKGDYSHSMVVARDAMEKIKDKPDKYDLRWRLVYPVMYYDDIEKFSRQTGNNAPLILGLIKEESYFDPLAQSYAGASGLMQLMPATADEINSRYSLGFNLPSDLFNPYNNIKLGSYYYQFLRQNLEGFDVSSVAAYNGGIGSLKNWKNQIHYEDTDEFVEQIPYPETKNYVKKVFRSYWNYVRLYSGNS